MQVLISSICPVVASATYTGFSSGNWQKGTLGAIHTYFLPSIIIIAITIITVIIVVCSYGDQS